MATTDPASSRASRTQQLMGIVAHPTGSAHSAYTMAAISAIGGTMGYIKGNSTRSLLAGIVFGGGFGYSAYMISTDQQARGFRFAAVNSALLAAVMGARFYRTGKPMPALPLAVAGLASLGYHGYKYSEWADWE